MLLHISDTHLGKREYNLDSREEDVYNVFEQLMDEAIKERVKAVIHTGDLFDVYEPSNRSKLVAITALKRLRSAEIPFISIPGDHDTPKRKGTYTHKLLREVGLLEVLSDLKEPRVIEDGVRVNIFGSPHFPTSSKEALKDDLDHASPREGRNVLMLHQGLREYLPYDNSWQLQMMDLPQGFNYYALGHLHSRKKVIMPDGSLLAIAGSPEIMRREEIDDWRRDGKGAYLVDLSKEEPNLHKVDIEVRPQQICEVESQRLEDEVQSLIKELRNLPRKPILHIILTGTSMERAKVMKILSRLAEVTEHYRLEDRTVLAKGIRSDVRSMGANEIIIDYLRENGYNQEEISQILQLLESEEVEEQLKRFAGL
jgi:DNA repair exonuclease SbcCD nuclease subunit